MIRDSGLLLWGSLCMFLLLVTLVYYSQLFYKSVT